MVVSEWRIRDESNPRALDFAMGEYENEDGLFALKVHHGGAFTELPDRRYVNGKISYVDFVDVDLFSVIELDAMMVELGYKKGQRMCYHFLPPQGSLDSDLHALSTDDDIRDLNTIVALQRLFQISIYIEHGLDWQANDNAEPQNVVKNTEQMDNDMSYANVDLNDITFDDVHIVGNEAVDKGNLGDESNVGDEAIANEAVDKGKAVQIESEDSEGSEDSDYFADPDNELVEYEVDMRDYRMHIDPQVEYMGANVNTDATREANVNDDENLGDVGEDEDLGVINNDEFSSGDDPGSDIETAKANYLRSLNKKQRLDDNETFQLGQTFGTKEEVKELIKSHSVNTKRQLKMVKNDNERITVKCVGHTPIFGHTGPVDATGPSEDSPTEGSGSKMKSPAKKGQKKKSPVKKKGPKKKSQERSPKKEVPKKNPKKAVTKKNIDSNIIQCPWYLHVSKLKKSQTWMVKTITPTHKCLQSRVISHCNQTFLAKQLQEQLESNPEIPPSAIQDQFSRKLDIGISWMKAFRAKQKAEKMIKGDYQKQYLLLKDYLEELRRSNPNTTVRLDFERPQDPESSTRQFRRIYVCLGACKAGFKECMREIVGLDGAFMKGPYPGWVLTAVGLDPNNGIYPIAYAIVEAETTLSWTWFLTCLGEDLDLSPQSNFTFISDRQKGIIPAIARLFPSAEHRYCLKHIHDNMKSQWRGKAFKDCLWKAAIAPTVPQFQRAMDDLKRLSQPCFDWVSKIPPMHWARSHFTGRAKSDILLNNLCEVFNRRLLKARESPIITAIDFIREYMMKRISVVCKKGINRCTGPLTPTGAKLLEVSMKDANRTTVIWDGAVGYQVAGPWGDQCVVDVALKTCTCRRWELTGIPCLHAVAAINNMSLNSMKPGSPESWVHECYWLSTWKKVYSHKIGGTNGQTMWHRSQWDITITPPVHHTPVGRPKKKRKRSFNEESMVKTGSNNSRKLKTLTCGLCGNLGHNSRGCKGQGVPGSTGEGSSRSVNQGHTQPSQSQPQPTASQHQPSQSQPQPTASQHQPSKSQSQPTASQHQPSQSQSQATASQTQATPSQSNLGSAVRSPVRLTKKMACRLSPDAGKGSKGKKVVQK